MYLSASETASAGSSSGPGSGTSSPIDPNGVSFVDSTYSKAYLRHLFSAKEILGKQIATIHNLGFYIWLTNEARRRILDGTFYNWKEQMVKKLSLRL